MFCYSLLFSVNLQSKSRVRQSSTHTTSPPLSPRAPSVADSETAGGGGEGGEDAAEGGVNEHQQQAMQQEERILTEQIESLQKEKYVISLVQMLTRRRKFHV